MKFLIIHGSFGNPEENWFPRLKQKLELLGQNVLVPKFPIDDWDELTEKGKNASTSKQTLKNWIEVFEKKVLPWAKNKKVVLIAHSLGPLFSLHALNKFKINVDSGIFVSPFLYIPR